MNLWMWRPGGDPLSELGQQMNRLLDLTLNMVGQQFLSPAQPFLACNLYEAGEAFIALLPLPGVAAEELELHVAGGALTLRGERRRPGTAPEETYRRQERWMGRWTRTIQLPPRADLENVSASLENGLLLIRIPKLPEAKPKSLPIKVGRSHQDAAAPRLAEPLSEAPEGSGTP